MTYVNYIVIIKKYLEILVLKWRQVSTIQPELELAQVHLCTRKYFKLSGTGSLYEK